jgi:hypothetical protein
VDDIIFLFNTGLSPVAPHVSKSNNDDFDSLVRVDVVNKIVCHTCNTTRGMYSLYS